MALKTKVPMVPRYQQESISLSGRLIPDYQRGTVPGQRVENGQLFFNKQTVTYRKSSLFTNDRSGTTE